MRDVVLAVKSVFAEKIYILFMFLFAAVIFLVFVMVPVLTIPGNSFLFQLAIYRARDLILMAFLAVLVGFNFSANMYAMKKRNGRTGAVRNSTASGAVAGFSGVMGAVIGTAACSSCIVYIFGVLGLGLGSVAFVLEYQTLFLLAAIVLILFSIYYSLKGINKYCAQCA